MQYTLKLNTQELFLVFRYIFKHIELTLDFLLKVLPSPLLIKLIDFSHTGCYFFLAINSQY